MTTLTSPHDLLAAVPFLIGYHPINSLVVIALRGDSIGMAMRIDFPEDIDPGALDEMADHLVSEGADGALIVAYLPEDILDSQYVLDPLSEAIELRNMKIRECLEIRNGRWRSTICSDLACCPKNGNLLPEVSNSRIAAEQVANGIPAPFENLNSMCESIAPFEADLELIEAIKSVPKIDYEDEGFYLLQREGALAFADVVEVFVRDGICRDKELLALVLVRLRDLQVRDYAMGITDEDNIEAMWSMWRWLLRLAPAGEIAPVASLFSSVCYERGEGALAARALDRALADDSSYPLAKLLRRVYAAGWPPESFATMRKELHPKVCAALFAR
jgi:hypothetical protein